MSAGRTSPSGPERSSTGTEEPIRIGVVGCGAIAQTHHLPNLTTLDEFEIVAVCDLSAQTAEWAAGRFGVPACTTSLQALLESDLEAVLLCQADPKTDAAVQVLESGRHLFIEKPLCYGVAEAERIVHARQRAGVVAQVGYMKVYDPAFEIARQVVADLDSVSYVQVNHLHPNNALHLAQLDLRRFDDIDPATRARFAGAKRAAIDEAIGDAADDTRAAFLAVSGSMIHDLYGLRTLFRQPEEVVETEIWNAGRAIATTLRYASGTRCRATWVDLPDLWDFRETLEVFADRGRVQLSYPTGFARGVPSRVMIWAIDDDGRATRSEPNVDWASAFTRELEHFARCVRAGEACRTPVEDARDDVALIVRIIEAARGR